MDAINEIVTSDVGIILERIDFNNRLSIVFIKIYNSIKI
jgi:hypothetical protein